jgi:hypothetical protein
MQASAYPKEDCKQHRGSEGWGIAVELEINRLVVRHICLLQPLSDEEDLQVDIVI